MSDQENKMMKLNLSAFLQWKINILIYQKLGWRLAFMYIHLLGMIYFSIKRSEKNKIEKAVQSVFLGEKNKTEIKNISNRVFQGIFWHYYEKIFNVYSSVEILKKFLMAHIKAEGISSIEEGIARGKGVLLVTGHFGGIEFIPTFLAAQNYPVTILAKFSSNHLKKISSELAFKLNFRIIDAKNCSNIAKAIMDNLKENRIVITQCDEIGEWKPSSHDKISFLGKRISLDKTIDILLRRGDATLVFAIMRRGYDRSYQFVANSLEEMTNVVRPFSQRFKGELILKFLEQYIYLHPEEWYQWKKVPEIKTVENLKTPSAFKEPSTWMRTVLEKMS
jgi:Kdo2-lipid IVA lauroyltransferase/acyltransferase